MHALELGFHLPQRDQGQHWLGVLIRTEIAVGIQELTDDKSLDKAERKRLQVENAATKSNQAKLIKLADKTSNLRAIAFSPAPEWSVKRRLDYIDWAKSVVAGLRGTSPWLEEQFDKAAEAAERSFGVSDPRS